MIVHRLDQFKLVWWRAWSTSPLVDFCRCGDTGRDHHNAIVWSDYFDPFDAWNSQNCVFLSTTYRRLSFFGLIASSAPRHWCDESRTRWTRPRWWWRRTVCYVGWTRQLPLPRHRHLHIASGRRGEIFLFFQKWMLTSVQISFLLQCGNSIGKKLDHSVSGFKYIKPGAKRKDVENGATTSAKKGRRRERQIFAKVHPGRK